MYYRNNSNLGCFILILCILLFFAGVLHLLLSPAFWLLVAVLAVISWVQNAWRRRHGSDEGRNSSDSDYTEGTDDPERIEEVYETNVVDVDDVEVTKD